MLWQKVEPETYVSKLSAPLPPAHIVFAGPGYCQPKPQRNGLAVAALVLGIIGLLVPIAAIGAVVCGHIAVARRNRADRHLARGGYGLGWVSIGAWTLIVLLIATFRSM